jgi:death-on-curing protein
MRARPTDCVHLTVDIVEEIHAEAVRQFGGLDGLRDRALLESAVAAPQATFGGESVFADIVEVAAAYLFYICRNHPFLDGNKRTALGACIVFLRLNGRTPAADSSKWETLTFGVADGSLDRQKATARLRRLVGPRKRTSAEAR